MLGTLFLLSISTFDNVRLGVLADALSQAGEACYLAANLCCLQHISKAVARSWHFRKRLRMRPKAKIRPIAA